MPLTIAALGLGVASVLLLGLRLVSGALSGANLAGSPPTESPTIDYGELDPNYVSQQTPGSFRRLPGKRRPPDITLKGGARLRSWFLHGGTIAALGASAVLLALTGAGSAAAHNGLMGQCATGAALPLSGGFVLGFLGLVGSLVLRPRERLHRLRRGHGSQIEASGDGIPSGATTFSPQGSGTTSEPSGSGQVLSPHGPIAGEAGPGVGREVVVSFEEGQPDAPIRLSGTPLTKAETTAPSEPPITPSEVDETAGGVNLYAPVAPATGGHAQLIGGDTGGVGGLPTQQGKTVAPPGVELPNPIVQSEAYVQRLTDLLRSFAAGATLVQNEIEATVGDPAVIGTPDDLNTEDQLRLQLATDRRSKFEETISNILKKVDETARSITQNLK